MPRSTTTLVTLRPVSSIAPALARRVGDAWVTTPMPPWTMVNVPPVPGSRHMLWSRKLIPVPGVLQVPWRPEKPSVTAYMARRRSLLKSNRAR